jgi:hypothetical protein
MPLEIRELVIKATVGGEENAASTVPASSGEGQGREELIKLCVEKVLEILKDEKER